MSLRWFLFGHIDLSNVACSYPTIAKSRENTRTYLGSDPKGGLMDRGSLLQPGRWLEYSEIAEELVGALEVPERPLMSAGYADIYCGFWTNPQGERIQVAVKELKTPTPRNRQADEEALKTKTDTRLRREVFVWSQTKHPNLHPFLGYCSEHKPRLISPWCRHGNLNDYLHAHPDLTRRDKLRFIYEAACGLEHLHSRTPPICHADIKPENILINDYHTATLSDFGLSRVVQDLGARSGFTTSETVKGTSRYMAKELFDWEKPNLASDVYAFGGLILTVMSGKPPFDGLSPLVILSRVVQDKPPIQEDHPQLPPDDPLWKLMRRCWNCDPLARPTMGDVLLELLEYFNHEESNLRSRPDLASVTDNGANEYCNTNLDIPGALKHRGNLPLITANPIPAGYPLSGVPPYRVLWIRGMPVAGQVESTSTASAENYEGPSGEALARQLQSLLHPPSADPVEILSTRARDAIGAVVEAVGQQVTPHAGQPTEMLLRVAAVVTAVRNLLYVSGTLNAPIANIHLSRQYASSPNSTSYVEEALHESGRAPLLELKPYQRKVTATLSKLVLSARAADSNPDWPYDDATTRVDSDAGELERAVVSFVMEVKRMEIMGSVVLAEKRLEGVLVSGEGLAGVGTAIYGAGLGGEWKGMGFIPTSEGGSGSGGDAHVFPQWSLGSEPLNVMRGMMIVVEEGLTMVLDGPPISVEILIPRLRHILSHLSAFLAMAEDIDVARTVDVDGIIYPSPHPLDPGLVDTYNNLVQTARKLMRKLECDKQAVFDEGSNVWLLSQAIFVDRAAVDPVTLVKLRLEFLQAWDNPAEGLQVTADILKSAMVDTVDDYQKLYEVARKQEDAHRHGIRASIGLRDGQISQANRHRLSLAGPRHHGAGDLLPSADEVAANLDFHLDDVIDEDEDAVDVGFALRGKSRTKASAAAQYANSGQLQAPGDPTAGRAPSSAKGHGPSLDISTIRPSTDGRHPEDEEDDDLDFDLHPTGRKPPVVKAPARARRIVQIFGTETLAHYVATLTARQQPWFLWPDNDEKSILVNPDGGVRGGTLIALVERLTLPNYCDAVYNDTFLITFKSFTTVDELFDLLVARFNIPEPAGLKPDEQKQWAEKKQTPIRFRVINTLKMLMEGSVLEKEDMHILGRIREFASEAAKVVAPAQQLTTLAYRAENGEFGRVTKVTTTFQPPPAILPKSSRALKLMDVDPLEMARQLTIMESRMFVKIRPMECLSRAKEGKGDDDNIGKIINMSNKIASWVAEQVLSKDDPRRRGTYIKQFILIAERCREMNNFSSMAALLAGLNSPPVRRLKRTWETIAPRVISRLDDMEKTLDSGRNFKGYRQLLATIAPPCIPFLGVYLMTLAYIQAGNKDIISEENSLINFSKWQKAAEVIREIKTYQPQPYNLTELPNVQDLIEKSLARVQNSPDFWELSIELEPREREDENMVRLLQESGLE